MKKVLFIGDINADLILGGLACFPMSNKEITCKTFDTTIGSSAAIAACTYASLGGNAYMLGLAGNDDLGDFVLHGLEEFGVNTHLIRRTDEVRTGVTVNMVLGETRTQVTYPGTIEAFSGSELRAADLEPFDAVHFAGPYQQTALRPEIARLLSCAADYSLQTSLDPQWDASEAWEYMDQWMPQLTYLLLNEDEARSLTKTDDLSEACRLLGLKTSNPIIKMGKHGAMLMIDDRIQSVPSSTIEPVDTIGAGDAFDAGFLYARIEAGWSMVDAVRFGNAVGALNCQAVGGVGANITLEKALAFMRNG